MREPVVQDQEARFTRPYHGDLHLLDDNDDLASVLASRNVLGVQGGVVVAWGEEIGASASFFIEHHDEDCVAACDEESHDIVVILEAFGRAEEERAGDESCDDDTHGEGVPYP